MLEALKQRLAKAQIDPPPLLDRSGKPLASLFPDVPTDGDTEGVKERVKQVGDALFYYGQAEKLIAERGPKEIDPSAYRPFVDVVSHIAAVGIAVRLATAYRTRAQDDPDEQPFLKQLPSDTDAFAKKWGKSLIVPVAELVSEFLRQRNYEREIFQYIDTHLTAWVLQDALTKHGFDELEALSQDEYQRLMADLRNAGLSEKLFTLSRHFAESVIKAVFDAASPYDMPLPELRALLGLDADPGPSAGTAKASGSGTITVDARKLEELVSIPTPDDSYLTVFSPPHYHALREALAKKDFHQVDGSPWPTALLNRGGARGHAQLRPAAADGLMPPEEVEHWQKIMWRQREELSDLDADVLDALAANWLRQARSPQEDAVADVDGLLAMRGLKPKRSGQGRRGGYTPEQRRAILQALSHIQNLWIDMAEVEVYEDDAKGRRRKVTQAIQSRPFVITDRMGQLRTDGYIDVLGYNHRFIYRPGAVFARFLMGAGRQTALLSAKALRFDPERQRHEKRLTRYLSWQWRARAHKGSYLQPYRVKTLLEAADLEENRRRGARIRERLEKALERLLDEGVISAWQYDRWDEATAEQRDWFDQWLQATIVVEPPNEVLDHYRTLLQEPKALAPKPAATAANLGEQLRAHRKRLGLTQLEAAEQIGISRSYLARIENGSSQRVGKDTREKVLAWLNG